MNDKQKSLLREWATLKIIVGPEKLNAELKSHLTECGVLGPCVQHPLVYAVPYIPAMNGMLNAQLRAKREACAESLRKHDWSGYVIMHEKPYRFQALNSVSELMSDEAFWELFADTYVGSENWHEPANRSMIESWLYDERGGPDALLHMMTDDERAEFVRLPQAFRVVRGWNRPGGFDGYSWSRSNGVAEWFAKRMQPEGVQAYVAVGRVSLRAVLAVFSRRSEREVLVSTADVRVSRIVIGGDCSKHDRRPVVSFDFDGTLHREMNGLDPAAWTHVPHAHVPTCDLLRRAAKDARVVIVTRRDQMQLDPVLDFVRVNELPVEAVYPTSDMPKQRVLGRLRPLVHYDDDPATKQDCPEGTSFVLSQTQAVGRRSK